jgi:hypothetical protein
LDKKKGATSVQSRPRKPEECYEPHFISALLNLRACAPYKRSIGYAIRLSTPVPAKKKGGEKQLSRTLNWRISLLRRLKISPEY